MASDETARAIYIAPIEGITKNSEIKKNRLHFPVTPSEFSKGGPGQWTTNNVIGLGEVAHPVGPSLSSYTMSGFFPPYYSQSLCKGLREQSQFREPRSSCTILENLRDTNDVFWLVIGTQLGTDGLTIVGESTSNVVMDPVRITEFSWSEVAGRPDSRLYDITFSQWTQVKPGTLVPFAIPKIYQPKPPQDLRDVAVLFYRDINQWKRIALVNSGITNKKSPLIPKVLKGPKKGSLIVLKLPNPV